MRQFFPQIQLELPNSNIVSLERYMVTWNLVIADLHKELVTQTAAELRSSISIVSQISLLRLWTGLFHYLLLL